MITLKPVCTLTLALVLSPTVQAASVTLIDENFNDVSGLARAQDTRPVAEILRTAPNQLPPGTRIEIFSQSPNYDYPLLTEKAMNVRRTDNEINTTPRHLGFSGHFQPVSAQNRFLILGDDTGKIDLFPGYGVEHFIVPFTLPAGTTAVTVSLDYAFNGIDFNATEEDTFQVAIIGAAGGELALITLTSPDGFDTPFLGQLNQTVSMSSLPTGPLSLRVTTIQEGVATHTAVAVDNIRVHAHLP